MKLEPTEVQRNLRNLRAQILSYLDRSEDKRTFVVVAICRSLQETSKSTSFVRGVTSRSTVTRRVWTSHAESSSINGRSRTKSNVASAARNSNSQIVIRFVFALIVVHPSPLETS
jgi:hypothetical protein